MTLSKNYLQPVHMLMNSIHGLAGLEKAKTVLADVQRGLLRLKINVYAEEREYTFRVEDFGGDRSSVFIELEGGGPDTERLINHQFALLDYINIDENDRIEIIEPED